MLNIQAVNLFLALSRAEKISSRKPIPIGSKMAFRVHIHLGNKLKKMCQSLPPKRKKEGPQESFQLINTSN